MGVRGGDLGCHWQRQGNMVLSVVSSVECAGVCECVGGGRDSLPVLLCVHMFVFLNILNALERKSAVVSFYYAVLPVSM